MTEFDLVGVYKNALHEIQRRIQDSPSPAILFEIDEIIKKAMESEARYDLPNHAETMGRLNSLTRAEDANVYLPGTRVTAMHKGRQIGTCIVPSTVAIDAPHNDSDVYVCWPNGDAEWVPESFIIRAPLS